MSAPHFLRGDEELVAAVDGLEPSVDLHDTVLLVEKMTGLVLLAHKRIMVSFLSHFQNRKFGDHRKRNLRWSQAGTEDE